MHQCFPLLLEAKATCAVFLRILWRALRIWIVTIILSEFIAVPVLLLINADRQGDYDLSNLIPALYVFVHAVFYSLISIPLLIAYLYVDERIPAGPKKHLFRIISCCLIFCFVWLYAALNLDYNIIGMLRSLDAMDCVAAVLILLCCYASLYIHKKETP